MDRAAWSSKCGYPSATCKGQLSRYFGQGIVGSCKEESTSEKMCRKEKGKPEGCQPVPDELLQEVLARVPTRDDLLTSRLVCKTWNRAILSVLGELPCCMVICQLEPDGLPEVSEAEYHARMEMYGEKKAIIIDTRTSEHREIKLPLSLDKLSYTSGKWGLIALDNEEDCYFVGNPLTNSWRAVPYPFRPQGLVSKVALVVDAKSGSYKIVVFVRSCPPSRSEMRTHVFDSKSCKWRDGLSWEGQFSTLLRTWVWYGLVYFVYEPNHDHFELWSMDPDSDTFQQVTPSAPLPSWLILGDCFPYTFDLVLRRHLGVQNIEMVGMVPLTLEQELSDPRVTRLEQLSELHLRVYAWNSRSLTWVVRKEVASNNVSSALSPASWEDWQEQGVFAYRGYFEHLGQVRVCRPDTLEECRYEIEEEDLSVYEVERDVMLFHPRLNFRP